MTIILETTMRKFYINHSTTEHTLKCCIKVYKLHSNINCENEITEEISDTFGGMPIEKVAPVDLFTFLLKTTKNAWDFQMINLCFSRAICNEMKNDAIKHAFYLNI